jgi:VWFA-related protein
VPRISVRPALLPLLFLSLTIPAVSQGRGSGGSRGGSGQVGVDPATNARNAAVLGRGNNLSITHPPSANDEAKVEFRSQSVLIQVPVVITDKSGNHIHGLAKESFSLFENGKPVSISHFEEFNANNTPIASPPAADGKFRNLTIDSSQHRNVVVIALDTVNTPYLDQAYGRRELVKFLAKNIDSHAVLALMLITSHGLRVVQGLTDSPDALVQILKKIGGEISPMETQSTDVQADLATGNAAQTQLSMLSGTDPFTAMNSFVDYGDVLEAQFFQQNAIDTTMNAFLGIAWSLSGVPGRKSLIWATGGFPFMMNAPDNVPGGNLTPLYERTMLALDEAQVSVYPVDIRGLMSSPGLIDASSRGGARSGLAASQGLTNRVWLQQSKFDTLNDFADMTGGRAFYNTNDLAGAFKKAADDGASYYMLEYYLDTHDTKAGWRKLKIKTDRKDVEVRARTGFFVTNATMNPLITRDSDMLNALQSPIEGTGVPMTVEWVTVASAGDNKKKAVFFAHMAPGSLSLDPAGRDQLNFDFAALAYDKNGKEAVRSAERFEKPVPAAQLASVRANGVGFRNALELTPGKYTVRFVVRDNVTGKVGSLTAPITVE